jgi:hypothetical protein
MNPQSAWVSLLSNDVVGEGSEAFHLQINGVAGLQESPHLQSAAAAMFSGLANRAGAGAKEFAGI